MVKARRSITEAEARLFMVQILGAVGYMHSMRILHRDIKLSNIFLDAEMNVKIGDFGLAAVLADFNSRANSMCGTPNYIAPEILLQVKGGHSFEVDIWSIGIAMYAMLVGKPPFSSKDLDEIYRKIKRNCIVYPEFSHSSLEAKNLIRSLLSSNPDDRPTIQKILRHPWFTCDAFPEKLTQENLRVPFAQNMTQEEIQKNFQNAVRESGLADNGYVGFQLQEINDYIIDIRKEDDPHKILPMGLSPRPRAAIKSSNKQVLPEKSWVSLKKDIMIDLDDFIDKLDASINREKLQLSAVCRLPSEPCLSIKQYQSHRKYGAAYQLTDGSLGMLYNDSTSIVLHPLHYLCCYLDYDNSTQILYFEDCEKIRSKLEKKLFLIQKFIKRYKFKINDPDYLFDIKKYRFPKTDSEFAKIHYVTHRFIPKLGIGLFRLNHGNILLAFGNDLICIDKNAVYIDIYMGGRFERKRLKEAVKSSDIIEKIDVILSGLQVFKKGWIDDDLALLTLYPQQIFE